MKREPCPPEELIEDIVGLSISVWQSTAENVHFEVLVEFGGGDGEVLKVLHLLVSWEWDTTLEGLVVQDLSFALKWSASP